jgi:trans-aconitate methyltransferase
MSGFEVEGLDRAEGMIAQAKSRRPDIGYYVGDVCYFNLGKELVWCRRFSMSSAT